METCALWMTHHQILYWIKCAVFTIETKMFNNNTSLIGRFNNRVVLYSNIFVWIKKKNKEKAIEKDFNIEIINEKDLYLIYIQTNLQHRMSQLCIRFTIFGSLFLPLFVFKRYCKIAHRDDGSSSFQIVRIHLRKRRFCKIIEFFFLCYIALYKSVFIFSK